MSVGPPRPRARPVRLRPGPGQLTGPLRVEDHGVRYTPVDGPEDEVVFPVGFTDGAVDLQVWASGRTALSIHPAWSIETLATWESRVVTASVSIVDYHPMERIAIAHRDGRYVFFALYPALATGHDGELDDADLDDADTEWSNTRAESIGHGW